MKDENRILDFFRNPFVFTGRTRLYHLLGTVVIESVIGVYDGLSEPLAGNASERSHFKDSGKREFLFIRTERAQLVGKLLGKHRHCSVNEIYRRAAAACLFIHHRARTDIMGHVRDMDTNLIVPVLKDTERKGVIKVLCIGRVYSECEYIPEIPALSYILGGYLVRNAVSRIRNLRFETIREGELRKDGMHFGVILARLSEHIHDVSVRGRLMSFPSVHHCGHLHSGTGLKFLTPLTVLGHFKHIVDCIYIL